MSKTQELDEKIEAIERNLQDACEEVSNWSPAKRDDVQATMYAPSLSTFYESVIRHR